jgi:hypothetical protein
MSRPEQEGCQETRIRQAVERHFELATEDGLGGAQSFRTQVTALRILGQPSCSATVAWKDRNRPAESMITFDSLLPTFFPRLTHRIMFIENLNVSRSWKSYLQTLVILLLNSKDCYITPYMGWN